MFPKCDNKTNWRQDSHGERHYDECTGYLVPVEFKRGFVTGESAEQLWKISWKCTTCWKIV